MALVIGCLQSKQTILRKCFEIVAQRPLAANMLTCLCLKTTKKKRLPGTLTVVFLGSIEGEKADLTGFQTICQVLRLYLWILFNQFKVDSASLGAFIPVSPQQAMFKAKFSF